MLSHVTVQNELIDFLEALVTAEKLPAGLKVAVYTGEINLAKMTIDAARFPAILIVWQGDESQRNYINETRDHAVRFNLIVVTNSTAGLTEAMAIADALNAELPGAWQDDDGAFLWDVFTGPARPLLNLKTKQAIVYPVACNE